MKKTLMLALVGFVFVGCATTAPYNPFKIPKDEIYGKVQRIALVPVEVPEDLETPYPVNVKFESLIETTLREAGFEVIRSEAYSKTWKQTSKRLGGLFDPSTGKADKAKFKTAREQCRQEMREKFNANALLYPHIVTVKASFSYGGFLPQYTKADWDGVSQKIGHSNVHGTVAALSLLVAIEDAHGASMYVNKGGIQALSTISEKFLRGAKFVPVPREELFANEERNKMAVDIALGPLVAKSAKKD